MLLSVSITFLIASSPINILSQIANHKDKIQEDSRFELAKSVAEILMYWNGVNILFQ